MKQFSKRAPGALTAFLTVGVLTACANPLNQATSDRYSETCAQAERNRRLDVAEEACSRALVNVDWGHLGDVAKSQKTYNLARIKRQLRKFDEAEKLYKDSLAIEEKQTPSSSAKIGRRLAELAILNGQQNRFDDGLPYVERLFALADTFQGDEKTIVAAIFYVYSRELPLRTAGNLAGRLSAKAVEMGYDPATYKK